MRRFFVLLAFLAFSFIPTAPSFAGDAQVVNIQVTERYADIFVSAELESAFTDEVNEALLSGTPITFTYHLNLKRSRSFFYDKTEARVTIHKIVKYDSFAKEYNALEIIADELPEIKDFEKALLKIKDKNMNTLFGGSSEPTFNNGGKYLSVKDIGALQAWLSSVKRIVLSDTLSLHKDKKYYVEVKVEMEAPGLSSPFRYILFFISSPDFDTEWENSTAFIINKPELPLKRMLGKNSR